MGVIAGMLNDKVRIITDFFIIVCGDHYFWNVSAIVRNRPKMFLVTVVDRLFSISCRIDRKKSFLTFPSRIRTFLRYSYPKLSVNKFWTRRSTHFFIIFKQSSERIRWDRKKCADHRDWHRTDDRALLCRVEGLSRGLGKHAANSIKGEDRSYRNFKNAFS